MLYPNHPSLYKNLWSIKTTEFSSTSLNYLGIVLPFSLTNLLIGIEIINPCRLDIVC